jgi:N-ethylmaleimide reductase
LLLEVVDAVGEAIGTGRLGVRLSPLNSYNDITDSEPLRTFGYAAAELGRRGIAYLHLSQLGDAGDFDWPTLRRAFAGPVILNGGYDAAKAEAAIADGGADLVSFGVAFLANPDLPERFRSRASLNAPHRSTFYGGGEEGYTDYPFMATRVVA